MERLEPADYEAVLGFLRQLYAVERLEAFPRRAMAGLGQLIESDILTYSEIDPRRQHAQMIDEPAGVIDHSQVATFERFPDQPQFRNLALRHEFFGPHSVNYQMAVTIPSSPALVIGIALNRSRHDFSERDRSVLEAIRPHLAQAYRNAAERTRLSERLATRERTPPDSGCGALTNREYEILALVAEGKTNSEIGARLSISGRTVQKHLEHIYQKLRVRTRTAAAMKLKAPTPYSAGHAPSR